MKKTEFLFPIFVLILSTLNIWNNLSFSNIPSTIVSLAGIVGVMLFFLKKPWYKQLIYFWIISQVVVVLNYWEVYQILSLKFGFFFVLRNNQELGLYVNFVPLFYIVGFRLLQLSTIIGARISIKRYNKDSRLRQVLPVDGTVMKSVNLSGEKEWLLVNLEKPITILNTEIKSVLIKAEGEKPLQMSKKKQLSYLRITQEPFNNDTDTFSKEDTKFLDWVVIEAK